MRKKKNPTRLKCHTFVVFQGQADSRLCLKQEFAQMRDEEVVWAFMERPVYNFSGCLHSQEEKATYTLVSEQK